MQEYLQEELDAKYAQVTDEVLASTTEPLVNCSTKHGHHPDDSFHDGEDSRPP